MNMNWDRVARALETAAGEKQNEANAQAVGGDKAAARMKDETASLLRILASAIRFGASS
jgi:hypothetical protein